MAKQTSNKGKTESTPLDSEDDVDFRTQEQDTEFTNKLENPEGWEEEQTGFPPYWNPSHVGNSYRGIVIGKDDRDEKFPRWVLRATVPLICAQGEAKDAERVEVNPGEFFTTSEYVALNLAKYIGLEIQVRVKNFRTGVGQGEGVWQFTLTCSPETRKILRDRESKALEAARATE